MDESPERVMGFRAEVDAITPRLRRFARALVAAGSDDADAADSLVQETILRAMRDRGKIVSMRLEHCLYATIVEVHSERSGRTAAPGAFDARTGGAAEALAAVAPDDRAALLLVTLEDFSYEEAAEVLRIPRAVLVQRLLRVRRLMPEISVAPAAAPTRRPNLRIVK
jgi:RNA polymerase sigma-70 factor (ECF subfamily)